jgi:hypothetical protein
LRRSSPLLMKKKPRPWALMNWSEDWTDDWSEEREGVKTGPWPWPWLWSSPLLWLSVG